MIIAPGISVLHLGEWLSGSFEKGMPLEIKGESNSKTTWRKCFFCCYSVFKVVLLWTSSSGAN